MVKSQPNFLIDAPDHRDVPAGDAAVSAQTEVVDDHGTTVP